MRLVWPVLGLALLVVGCVSAPDAPADPTASPAPTAAPSGPTAPVEVVNESYDFSTNPEAQRNEQPLEFPAGARAFEFSVSWSSATPTAATRNVRVSVFDEDGSRVGDCNLGNNVVTQVEGRDCGPQMNNIRDGTYKLTWEGTGNVQAHVVITAS